MKKTVSPDYKKIYTDIIERKYPEKITQCHSILRKQELSALDIIKLNSLLFDAECKETSIANQRHKSYDLFTIQEILEYQKKNMLNNTQVAIHFKLSRNTVAKWRKMVLLTSLSFLFMRTMMFGQVGIGTTTPDPSSILELNVNNLATGNKKGFLGPKVALTSKSDIITIPNPATGFLVFNLGTDVNFTYEGYVFWNGTEWRKLDNSSLATGTIDAINCNYLFIK